MNESALIAVAVFAAAFLAIFGALYAIASKSHKRGEMGSDGIVVLRWALLGFLVIYGLLAITAVLD
ncbi:MAG: hypothetical protein JRN20_03150 [Nitrososphaerota archaeon]|nr:hypothetical protein [Nitrososphaerota archaeon]MDG6922968.1 hypothetical protein [Nitrososphaerota archaeon]